jgi:L-ascorbate metabolism protein UlaG (beta-lactamase superfamily)
MKIQYLGHSSFLIEFGGKQLLIDPFITPTLASKTIDICSLKPDYILLTHGHMDHVLDAEAIAKQSSATIISNFEIVSWYEQKGITGHPLNHGGKFTFSFGTVKYVNAVHSSVMPDGSYGGNPGGFVIWNDDSCLYIAGDTALNMDMKLIPMTCPTLDAAILPIGDNFTMGIDDAVIASQFIACDKILGCHFDTFPPIKIDHNQAIESFKKANKELILMEIGESMEL